MNARNVIYAWKAYREQHKEAVKQYAKEYYERKKEELNEKQNVKTECPLCKCMVRKYTMSRHEQSIKHQIKLKGQGQPKVIRNGDDETGIMGI